MGFVNSLPGQFESIAIKTKTNTLDANKNITGESWTTTETVDGKVQIGSMAQSLVSDKFKPLVDALAFIDPLDVTMTITELNKITVNSKDYSILYVDNIEGVSIEIPLKLWEN